MLRAARWPVVIVLAIVAAGIVLTLTRSTSGLSLDPESPEPQGSRALARLLEREGISVEPIRSSVDVRPADATLVVTQPNLLRGQALRSLAEKAATVVLVAPDQQALDAVVSTVRTSGHRETEARPPRCDLPAAVAAGSVTLGGKAYAGEQTCYDGTLVRAGNTVALGTRVPLTNDALDDEGNAALAMRLLGQQQRIVWYMPSGGDPGLRDGEESVQDLLPRGWVFGAVQAGIAAVLFAVWRARRLGPVVTEPLPVVVLAAETVEGRARLYRRAGATEHAAEALRRAARERLLPVLGLGADAQPQAVLAAIANRTGRDAGELLYGPPPADTAALVRLADALDALEEEVGI